MLYSLLYTSRAVAPLSSVQLQALLVTARAHNTDHHITGVLFYSEEQILQVLEGPAAEVETLFAKIQCDPRHAHIQLLGRGRVTRREFPHWSMGFHQPSDAVLRQLLPFVHHPDRAFNARADLASALSLRDLLAPFVRSTAPPLAKG